jgi:hypothetical protein
MSSHAEQAGPLAGMFTEETGEAVEEHEIFANFTLACYSHRRGDLQDSSIGEFGPRHGDGYKRP